MTTTQQTQYLNAPSVHSQSAKLRPPSPNTMSLDDFYSIFGDEISSERWFENLRWSKGIRCSRCGDNRFTETKLENRAAVVPYWCFNCRKRFSVRTGTRLQGTNLPLRKWALSIYLSVTGPITSTALSGYLGTEAHTAWSVLKRTREAWGDPEPLDAFEAEIDETYFGKRGTEGKIIVLGMKSRDTERIAASVISRADLPTIRILRPAPHA